MASDRGTGLEAARITCDAPWVLAHPERNACAGHATVRGLPNPKRAQRHTFTAISATHGVGMSCFRKPRALWRRAQACPCPVAHLPPCPPPMEGRALGLPPQEGGGRGADFVRNRRRLMTRSYVGRWEGHANSIKLKHAQHIWKKHMILRTCVGEPRHAHESARTWLCRR